MDCKGKTMKGKDGTYVSKPDKNNRYKWVKQSSQRRIKNNRKNCRETTFLKNVI